LIITAAMAHSNPPYVMVEMTKPLNIHCTVHNNTYPSQLV